MRVYSSPIPDPEIDFGGFDVKKTEAQYDEHKQKVIQWLRENGYNGPRTGEIVRFPVADGYAQYMLADAGKKSVLIHLPYWDGWQYRDVEFLPLKEILKRIDQQKKRAALFASK